MLNFKLGGGDMTRTLDKPIATSVAAQITGDELHIVLYRNPDMSVNETMSGLMAVQNLRDAEGRIVTSHREGLRVVEWPSELRELIIAVREYLKQMQISAGKLPHGKDVVDL